MERRIAAVLAADMVGYSRLVERDEVGTLKRQKRHLKELIEPTIAGKNGRIVKLTGDGLIAEFSSVVEAVQCAVFIQAEMAAREEDFPDDEKIQYRVAVHLGDVVFDDGDVYGDGVNVAARLEGLAEPGGVVVSGTAYDVLKANVDVAYKSLGEQKLKNIATPVRVYQVVEGVPIAPAVRSLRRTPWVAAAVVVLAMLGGLFWWLQGPDFEPLNPEELAFALPDRPSLAVLPFANLTGSSENDYLGEGIAGSTISSLGAVPRIFVIARQASFAYRSAEHSAGEIAEALGVRYVLDGSIQLSNDKLRTSVELIDALDGRQIWSKQIESDLSVDDLFAVQDQIVADVLVELDSTLVSGANSRSVFREAGDLETYKLIMLGTAEMDKFTFQADQQALQHFEAALERNPNTAYAHFGKSWVNLNSILMGYSADPTASLKIARSHAEKAVDANPDVAVAHIAMALVHLYLQEHDLAIASADRAISLVPGDGWIASHAGWILAAGGYPERGEVLLRFGLRAQPSPPVWVPNLLAVTLMMQGELEEAKKFFIMANGIFPNPMSHAHLAAIAALDGDDAEARRHVALATEIYPQTSVSGNARFWAFIRDRAYLERFLDALRQAGYPENPL